MNPQQQPQQRPTAEQSLDILHQYYRQSTSPLNGEAHRLVNTAFAVLQEFILSKSKPELPELPLEA